MIRDATIKKTSLFFGDLIIKNYDFSFRRSECVDNFRGNVRMFFFLW